MAYSYPRHDPRLPYRGRHRYSLTFCTDRRTRVFTERQPVQRVHDQILRAATEHGFAITAYCYMPDHLHLIVTGIADTSDCKAFIKAAKQYSGFVFKQHHGVRLWQRYSFERVIRDDRELVLTVEYILQNPVRGGLVNSPEEYLFASAASASLGAWPALGLDK